MLSRIKINGRTMSTLRAAWRTFLYSAGLSCILVLSISKGWVNVVEKNPAVTPATIWIVGVLTSKCDDVARKSIGHRVK